MSESPPTVSLSCARPRPATQYRIELLFAQSAGFSAVAMTMPILDNQPLARSLLALRLTVFVVMAMWAVDKLVDPQHTSLIYQHFYGLAGLGRTIARLLGSLELALLAAFVAGLWKRWTYGVVLLLHAVSTLSSFGMNLTPWQGSHLLFFAAWPMLAACYALYVLRDKDVLLIVSR